METNMNAPLKIFPICGDGQLTPKAGKHHVEYQGVARAIDLFYLSPPM